MRRRVWLLIGVFVFCFNSVSHGFILIHEILADPPAGIAGDANNDGVRSSSEDEFVELFNSSPVSVNVSDWYLTDAVSTRHVFLNNTFISGNSYFVLFGGGAPNLVGIDFQLASSGSLGLNNGGDTLSLFDSSGHLIDTVTYGSLAGNDESIVRTTPFSLDSFILHSSILGANGDIFSPGQSENQNMPQIVTPEPKSCIVLLLASLLFFRPALMKTESF